MQNIFFVLWYFHITNPCGRLCGLQSTAKGKCRMNIWFFVNLGGESHIIHITIY